MPLKEHKKKKERKQDVIFMLQSHPFSSISNALNILIQAIFLWLFTHSRTHRMSGGLCKSHTIAFMCLSNCEIRTDFWNWNVEAHTKTALKSIFYFNWILSWLWCMLEGRLMTFLIQMWNCFVRKFFFHHILCCMVATSKFECSSTTFSSKNNENSSVSLENKIIEFE